MNVRNFLFIIAFACLVALSCSSPVHVVQDASANLSSYHTYTWVETRMGEQDNSARPTAYIDLSVRNEVNKELAKRGWTESSSNPDLLISYDVLVKRSFEQRSDPLYTQPLTRLFYNPFTRHWVTIYYPSEFIGYTTYTVPVKKATVTITMADVKTDKVIWQGWTTEDLNGSRITEKEIQKAVKNIFRKFKVS